MSANIVQLPQRVERDLESVQFEFRTPDIAKALGGTGVLRARTPCAASFLLRLSLALRLRHEERRSAARISPTFCFSQRSPESPLAVRLWWS